MKRRWLVASLLVLLVPCAGWAGQKKERQKAQTKLPPMPMAPEQLINERISEMLAAWQLGDVERMHHYYADDVTVVSGLYEPLIMGWTNYARAYEAQRQRVRDAQITRRNTYVNVQGNCAWAAYQWEFAGMVDGQPEYDRGHTTLIFQKRNAQWLIVHNHTSIVPAPRTQAPAPSPTPATPPARKPGAE